MNIKETIEKFGDFVEAYYHAELIHNIGKGNHFLIIDFKKLAEFNIEISNDLLDNPEEIIKAFELSIRGMELGDIDHNFRVRVKNIPESQKILIRDLRTENLNKMVMINGTIRQETDVRPLTISIRYECPACGNALTVLQTDSKIKEPNKCGCGRKGKFKEILREKIDFRGMQLEELTTEIEGSTQPKRVKLFLKGDLVSRENDRRTYPGTNIKIIGVLKDMPIESRKGAIKTTTEFYIEVNYFEPLQEDLYNIEISKDDIKEINKLAKQKDIFEKLSNSLAPGIIGYEKIKDALVLQFLGGVYKTMSDGTKSRGDIHILLIGDPGSGKSQFLKRCETIAPKARYSSGTGSSGAGLTAAAVKDDFIGGWTLEAGTLPMTHKGTCIIDELDKMNSNDRDNMHEALEQQTVSIDKAGIRATLQAQTTVLAAANPKFSRFDPYGNVAEQINMPASLINRFDLIFSDKRFAEQRER